MNVYGLLRHCNSAVLRRAVVMAAVVGPTLILVNQGERLFQGLSLHYGKALLTMAVPFLVSCFSGAMAGLHGAVQQASREERLRSGLAPVVQMVTQVRSNALTVNSTARSRFEETSALLARAQSTVSEIQGGASLVQEALDAATVVQMRFDAVLVSEVEVKTEISACSSSAISVSAAIRSARERFALISGLAFEIERIGHQTTLLSVNAAVAAATAGPQGRRFAAIAESIRELARETEAQAKAIHATTRELEDSAGRMAEESDSLQASIDKLLACSDRASAALRGATESMAESSNTTRKSLDLLGLQSSHIRDIADGIGRVVDHAGAAIEGSARNAGLAKDVIVKLDTLVEAR